MLNLEKYSLTRNKIFTLSQSIFHKIFIGYLFINTFIIRIYELVASLVAQW